MHQEQSKTAAIDSLTIGKATKLVNCGLVSGLAQAILFNPWDKALYLSVKHVRPFIAWSNFEKPFAGLAQTVIQRTISSGLYFPMEEIFSHLLQAREQNSSVKPWATLLAGTLAGMVNGVIMNPFTRIKVSVSHRFLPSPCYLFLLV
jgi:hypothetical protein